MHGLRAHVSAAGMNCFQKCVEDSAHNARCGTRSRAKAMPRIRSYHFSTSPPLMRRITESLVTSCLR